jgi:p21-activated kinase
MEYCEIGNLLTFQAKLVGKTFTLQESLKVIVEVIKGLKCIHEKDFVHRDIKSENVLLKRNEKTN